MLLFVHCVPVRTRMYVCMYVCMSLSGRVAGRAPPAKGSGRRPASPPLVTSPNGLPPRELARNLASEGEDLRGRPARSAAQRFEAAAEQYVRATLHEATRVDPEPAGRNRAHTARARDRVPHALHERSSPTLASHLAAALGQGEAGGTVGGAGAGGGATSTALLPRLGAQLISCSRRCSSARSCCASSS